MMNVQEGNCTDRVFSEPRGHFHGGNMQAQPLPAGSRVARPTPTSGRRSASLSTAPAQVAENPYMAGFLTSAANPYFWIWWLSVGSALLISSLAGGFLFAVVFMIGHWGADVSWYVFVSAGVAKGRTILKDTTYHLIMATCEVFLVFFGIWYLIGPIFFFLH